jgi:hypothetical protein
MSIKLKMSHDFKGINIENINDANVCLKLTQLADDTTIYARDKHDAKHALNIIFEFSKHSGLNLNRRKTECLWIGRLKHSEENIDDIKCAKLVKALGITFGYDQNSCQKQNWEKPFNECKKTISVWEKHNLSLYGRAMIIKTLLIPKFVYLFHSLPVSKEIINDINKMIFGFLWKNGREKIKRKTLIGSNIQGGLNMIDIESFIYSIKLKWVKALLQRDNSNWRIIPEKLLNQYGENLLIFYMNISTLKELPNPLIKLTPFYTDIFDIFLTFKSQQKNPDTSPIKYHTIRQQIIWGNNQIKFKGKSLIFKHWISSNIIFINDIIDNSGNISEREVLKKLKNKSNWLAEINKIKKSTPSEWKTILRSNESTRTSVKSELKLIFKENIFDMTNKDFYRLMVNKKFVKPHIQRKWENIFGNDITWKNIYNNINKTSIDNRIKQFKFKLIHDILAIKQNLFTWKIESNPHCNICQDVENYEHFFIECNAVKPFLEKMAYTLDLCGITNNILSLKSLILGYKTSDSCYKDVNILLNIIGFSIYKSYYVSDKRKENINIENIFSYELKNALLYLEEKKTTSLFLNRFNDFSQDYVPSSDM